MKSHWVDVRGALSNAGLFRIPGLRARMFTTFGYGALIGIAAGMAIAMLVAPQSGPQLRQKLSSRVRELKGRAEGKKEEIRGKLERAAANAANKTQEAVDPYSDRGQGVPLG